MDHKLRDPATEMHLVKDLHTSLVSVPKLADADYITVLDKKGAKIYAGYTTTIKVSEKAVLEGYKCKRTGLWRIPLKARVTNENRGTLLIDRPNPEHAIGHVFELPSTEKNSPILSCSSGLSSKGNMAQSNQSRQLCNMAREGYQSRQ